MKDAGYRHFALANYYPSNPANSYPLTSIPGITLQDIPEGAIGSPNAEHFSFSNLAGGHFCTIGSTLATGSSGTGYGGTWQSFLEEAVSKMQYRHSGGITINHPRLSYGGDAISLQMLDFSQYVLGLEIWNSLGDWYYDGRGWSLDSWHNMLVTGRRCFGFGAPDHWAGFGGAGKSVKSNDGGTVTVPKARGMNRLLVPRGFSSLPASDQEKACLEAYHFGRFYVALESTSPVLVGVSLSNREITVEFASDCQIEFVSARSIDRLATTAIAGNDKKATYTLRGDEVYVRAMGSTSIYERSLTQPIMLIDKARIA